MTQNDNSKHATFAGGCFWCMIPPFQKLNGVKSVIAGYMGGSKHNPSYREVSTGETGHYEVVQIEYNSAEISYEDLLDTYWKQINPTDPSGQFNDRGPQYETVIFYHDADQKRIAEKSKENLNDSGKFDEALKTKILKANEFYQAEEYHQNFHLKNPEHYKSYKKGSGREDFINRIWGEDNLSFKKSDNKKFHLPNDKELRGKLTPIQYSVTRLNATEPPFKNDFYNNKKEGIYVDIISGDPLFSSRDKFDSGCGWPSFTKPLNKENIIEKSDLSYSMVRTEVRSKISDSHLGHVFDDGPTGTDLRYCINSAALRFIPVEELEKEGYGEYLKIF